jgi:hypothetical protein
MNAIHWFLLALLLTTSSASLAESPSGSVPVYIGDDPGLDACLSWGEVQGLHHSKLAVRRGPGVDYEQVDELDNGQGLYLCDASAEGDWIGVVYRTGESEPDCGVTSPVPERRAYDGPCKSGWVHRRWVRVIAG